MKDGLIVLTALAFICTVAVAAAVTYKPEPKPLKPCPGEVVSMVIDKDGSVLCTYMMIPQGIVKETRKMK